MVLKLCVLDIIQLHVAKFIHCMENGCHMWLGGTGDSCIVRLTFQGFLSVLGLGLR